VTERGNAAEFSYAPGPLDARVLLIKSGIRVMPVDGIGYPPHESNGWRGLVPEARLEISRVNCSHLDLVAERFAEETARHIAEALAAMRAGAGARPAMTQVG